MFGLLFCGAAYSETLISVKEAATTPQQPADYRLNYGQHIFQFGDLRIPTGDGPHPIAIVIHGGCWTTRYGLHLMDGMAARLTENGYATWNIEFRRVGQNSSAFPDVFDDVRRAALFVESLAEDHALDLGRIVLTGHSSGGHLALWLAGRLQGEWLRADSRVLGVVALAPLVDFEALARSDGAACSSSLPPLLGGTYEEVPDRYASESTINMKFAAARQILISGELDEIVPPKHVALQEKAQNEVGARVTHITSPTSGHFEMITPGTATWAMVENQFRQLIDNSPTATQH